jgi:hypothetical protein
MIRRTLIRDLADRTRVIVHVEMGENGDAGGLSLTFAVTTELYGSHGTHGGKSRHLNDRDPDSFGCLHDATLRAFPELAPLVALHLSDSETGEPMHAEANGLYFYRAARGLPGGWSDDYHHAKREGLTVDDYARRVVGSILRVEEIPLDDVPEQDLAAEFHQFVNDQRERWQRQAQVGREQLAAIPTIYELRGYDISGKRIERRSYPNCAEL